MDALDSLKTPEETPSTEPSDPWEIIDIDKDQNCPSDVVQDIFENLRTLELSKRPELKDFRALSRIEKDVTARAICVDWLVDAAKDFGFRQETLYQAVGYFDSCLMGFVASCPNVELGCIACLMIASKYHETDTPRVKEYADKYNVSNQSIIDMERSILKCLNYNLSEPTIWSFMERYARAAQGGKELECLASYIAELSLFEYETNGYLPSMVAASSVFLAKYILGRSTRKPWTPTLQHYTRYEPGDLRSCVMALHWLCYLATEDWWNAIVRKYSCAARCCVALWRIPQRIPEEIFEF